jgi:hypothetical protein
LQLLLALASAVIFGYESRRTLGHILPSQIRDFPFRRLLRLAGSQWRYSTPPPHGYACVRAGPLHIASAWTQQRTRAAYRPLRSDVSPLNGVIVCLPCRNLAMDVSSRIRIMALSPRFTLLLLFLLLLLSLNITMIYWQNYIC